MPKYDRPIQVLMIDDDIDYSGSVKNQFSKHRVILHFDTNLEDGLSSLKKNSKIQAVILDGKAPLKANQPRGTEKENFVHIAISELDKMKEKGKHYPYCVLTAWKEKLQDSLDGRVDKIYNKKLVGQDGGPSFEDIAHDLHKRVNELPITKLKYQHRTVFDFAEDYLDAEDHDLLVELLTCSFDSKKDFIQVVSLIRRLEESIMDVACEYLLEEDPAKYGHNNQSRAKNILDQIKANSLAPNHIIGFAYHIYSLCSKYFLHKNLKTSREADFVTTNYTVEICRYSILELICWAKDEIDKRKN